VKYIFFLIIPGCFLICSCQSKKAEMVSTESRAMTTEDREVKLSATSAERFPAPSAAPAGMGTPPAVTMKLADEAPATWEKLPATEFRLINYRFGASGAGECYISQSMGTVLDNANRWLKQFSQPMIDQAALEKLPHISFLGANGAWIEAQGSFAGGMGKAPVDGYALAGVVASIGGQIITVKMVGPAAEVAAEKEALQAYLKTVRKSD
jgi:hypothetical protein